MSFDGGSVNFPVSIPSNFNRAIFRSIPPAYPVRLPLLPITLWQGMIMLTGLCPIAPPMACADMLCRLFWRATSLAISL